MLSKEDLINAFNKSASDKETGEKGTNDDIMDFQERVRDLINTMVEWLEGTPVKFARRTSIINDVTTAPKTYAIESIVLSNDNKRITFIPTALYLMGCKGEVEIKYDGFNRNLKYNLYMKYSIGGASEPGVWTLIDANVRENNRQSFTQDIFYELVTKIA